MSSASPLHITVVYSRSSRGRRRSGRYIGSASAAAALLRLGLLNLLVAGALYYGTWWRVDPVLLVKILVHTEFRGVGSDDLVEQLIPDRHSPRRAGEGRTHAAKPMSQLAAKGKAIVAKAPTVQGLTSRGAVFGASLYGWEALSTLSICALALASGAMLRRGGDKRIHIATAVIAAGLCCVLTWKVYSLWTHYGGYVPSELRFGSAAAMAAATLLGLLFAQKTRRITRLAAALLILSAGGTVWGLHVGVQSNALDPKYATTAYLAAAFAVHSAWGWILIPLTGRFVR